MKYWVFVAVLVGIISGPVRAADWQESYQRYTEARDAGDYEAARKHARLAWEESRTALPPGETRALLAQNYVGLVFTQDPSAAREPLRDAVEMGEQGFGEDNVPLSTLRFLLATAEAWEQQRSRGATQEAYEAYGALLPSEVLMNDVVVARSLLARRLLTHGRNEEAASVAGRLSEDLQATDGSTAFVVQAEAVRAVAIGNTQPAFDTGMRSSKSRMTDVELEAYLDRLEEGVRHLRKAQALFPIQESIRTFDPGLAELYAYELYLFSLAYSYLDDLDAAAFQERVGRGRPLIYGPRCPDINWIRNETNYPAAERGSNGVVLYGYNINRKGEVEDLRILADVPGRRYGEHIMRYVSRWKADVGNLNEACRMNQLASHFFYTQVDR